MQTFFHSDLLKLPKYCESGTLDSRRVLAIIAKYLFSMKDYIYELSLLYV